MATPTGSLEPNTIIHHRYQVQRQIGRGGMGAVYEAIDTRLSNTVALKQTLVRDAQLDDAFGREARLLSSLRHAALPVVSDYFADGDSHFLVMQFIPGTDFGALLSQRSAPFGFGEVLAWADALLDALDYLHTQSPPIVHRDIKPQNLKLTPRGEIVLLDFGLAKGGAPGGDATAAAGASLYGYTPQYAPLEQIRGQGTDPRSDLYSLGATLYALLTNAPPANALDRAAALLQGLADPLRPLDELNPQVPAAVARLIARCMALNAADRPASAAAARAELSTAVRTGSAGASTAGMTTVAQPAQSSPRVAGPPPLTPGSPPPVQGSSWLVPVAIGLLMLMLIAVIGGVLVMLANSFAAQLNPDGPPPTAAVATARTPIVEVDPTPASVPPVAIPTIAIPDVGATVAAVQTSVAASFPQAQAPDTGDSGLASVALEFGADGSGNGFLNDPRGVAVGPDGAIYVSDYTTGRVQRFSPTGVFERSWRVEGDQPIMALAADREGRVFVSQASQISVFEGASGAPLSSFTDGNGFGFETMTVLGDGSLLGVSWASADVVRLDPSGKELERFADPLGKADASGSPSALAANGLGGFYLLDQNGENVFVFGPDGAFRDRFAVQGAWAFSDLAVDGQGRIYVSGFMPGGVQVFAADGAPVGRFGATGTVSDLSFDGQNNLFAVTSAPKVFKFSIAAPQ